MNLSVLTAFLKFVLEVLYYATPVFLIGMSFQILVIRTGNYKIKHKILLLFFIRITSLMLTSSVWIYLNMPNAPMALILIPAAFCEMLLYYVTLQVNLASLKK